ncbi:sensor histidine kinase [Flammeovirga sp. MY04]|uniref:sensor histidine kinase n=1 Tax=Flammeovirga sp. MY04 TaxID=1191459 RepID=UPI000806186D|nr:ATP-binding protein [Flammeovirga sp. MY04]ANQ50569.1 sensor histidine kinase [Flammeovirga sp. MY04]
MKTTESLFYQIPKPLISLTVFITVLPFLLHYSEIDLGKELNILESQIIPATHFGFLSFMLLRWSSITLLFITCCLAYIHCHYSHSASSAIVGFSFFAIGLLKFSQLLLINNFDVFSVELIKNQVLISTIYEGNILLASLISIMIIQNDKEGKKTKYLQYYVGGSFIFISILIVGTTDYIFSLIDWVNERASIYLLTFMPIILNLVLFGAFMIKFLEHTKSYLLQMLFWSILPLSVAQLHIFYGSTELFDAHFNISQFLLTVSFVLPFVGLLMDYIEMFKTEKRKTTELILIQQDLKSKNHELEQFAYTTSHDLQEPLRSITSLTELLKNTYKDQFDHNGNQMLDYIHSSADRMINLIKALLEYSKIGRNRTLSNIDCDQMMTDVLQDLRISLSESNAKIRFNNLPVIRGYEIELRLLFQNLITNAIKFKRPDVDPVVTISSIHMAGEWMFAFQDNGIGIKKEHLENIFIIFNRLHSKSEYEGSGIGLAHCQKIVDLHHGSIWVESDSEFGSTFYFTILEKIPEIE